MTYEQKYQKLRGLILSGNFGNNTNTHVLISKQESELAYGKKNHKAAFFELLFKLCEGKTTTGEVSSPIERMKKTKIEDVQDGEAGGAWLMTEEEGMLVFLGAHCLRNAFLNWKKLSSILHPFYSDQNAEPKKYNWLLANVLHSVYLNTSEENSKQTLQTLLIAYLCNTTIYNDAKKLVGDLPTKFPYLSINDFIFYRMTHIGSAALDKFAPAQNNFLDAVHRLMKFVDPEEDMFGYYYPQLRLLERIKPIFARLNQAEQLGVTAFINRLAKYEQNIRKLTQFAEQAEAGLLPPVAMDADARQKMIDAAVAYVYAEGGALMEEARSLFDRCMPGTLTFQILGMALIIIGLSIITACILTFTLPAVLALGVSVIGTTAGMYAAASFGIVLGCAGSALGSVGFFQGRKLADKSRKITALAEQEINVATQKVNSAGAGLNPVSVEELEGLEPESVDNDPTVLRLNM